MFVGNNQNARARFQYFRGLHRVHQPLDGAVDYEACLLQCCDNRRKPLDRFAGAGGADRQDLPVAWRRHDDVKWFCTYPQQSELGQVNIERTRLRL